MKYLLFMFGTGTGIGAVARFQIAKQGQRFQEKRLATLFVNLLGCLIAGGLFAISITNWLTLILLGFIGGFTTYSTFNNEVAGLLLKKETKKSIWYVSLSYLLGLLLCFSGYFITDFLIN